MAFIVVQFLETDEVSIITQSWLVDEDTCKWPPYKNKLLIKRALLEKRPPENDWEDCEIFIMGIHETYAKAKKEVAKALNTESDDDNLKPESKRKKVDSVLFGSQVSVKQEVFDSVSTSTPSQSSMSNGNQETAQSSVQNRGNNQSSASVLNRNKESIQVSSQNLTNGEFLSLLDSEVLVLNDDSTTQNIVLPDNVSMQLALIPSNSSSNGQNESTSGLSRSVNNNHSSSSKSSSCDCSHSKDFQHQVLNKLNKIISIQERIEEKLRALETGVTFNHNVKLDKFDKIYEKFPFKHENDIEEFEILLKNRDEIENVIHVLKGVGGSDENEMLQKILKKIFSDDVAIKYSWNGKSGKRTFKNLQLAEIIHRSIRCHFPSVTEQKVFALISKWLKYAKQRKVRKSLKPNCSSANSSVAPTFEECTNKTHTDL